ncbi:MAG TPA: hypothetical protein VFY06_03350 [Verrucomicrobiae bacterium]|nr:hypothetical protein [Verrucomicrobiae bacterium]
MDAPPRGALTLVCLIAIALVGYGLLEMGLYWADCLVNKQPVKALHFLLPSLPVAAGVVLLARSKMVAKWIAEKLE